VLKGAVAKRYAQALFELGREKGLLEEFLEGLRVVSHTLQTPALSQALENPKIPLAAKREMVHRFLPSLNSHLLNFVDLLISKGRVPLVGQICQNYERLLHVHQGIEVATVTTAVVLDEEQRARLLEKLSEMTGKQIILETKVDPNILGGLVVKIGDRVIDGSTTSKLKALKAILAEAA
jgi:F-type H+-transporting ATPase subunit delta